MDVRRHRRRWRWAGAWLIAALPWGVVLCAQGARLLPGAKPVHGWMAWVQIGLAVFFTVVVLIWWKPWKWEDQ